MTDSPTKHPIPQQPPGLPIGEWATVYPSPGARLGGLPQGYSHNFWLSARLTLKDALKRIVAILRLRSASKEPSESE